MAAPQSNKAYASRSYKLTVIHGETTVESLFAWKHAWYRT